jgi:hypothetical protein
MSDALKRRLTDAEAALSAALVSGTGIAAARAARDDAEKKLAAVKEAREAADAAGAQQETEAIATRADAISKNAVALLRNRRAQISMPARPAGFAEKIEGAASSAIAAAARHLAEAEAAEGKAGAAAKTAQDRRDRVACRIADLEAQRAAIVSRRAGGHMETDDGSRLALFAADLEGLGGLRADADQHVGAMQAAHDAAALAVRRGAAELSSAQDSALLTALMAYFGELDAAMLAALVELESVATRLGIRGRPTWGATPVLYHRLRTLAAQRGEM